MSELTESIEEAQSRLTELSSSVANALRRAWDRAEAAEGGRVQEAIDSLESALSYLSSAEDNIPTRYTEVGEVGDMGDSLENYVADATYAVKKALEYLV